MGPISNQFKPLKRTNVHELAITELDTNLDYGHHCIEFHKNVTKIIVKCVSISDWDGFFNQKPYPWWDNQKPYPRWDISITLSPMIDINQSRSHKGLRLFTPHASREIPFNKRKMTQKQIKDGLNYHKPRFNTHPIFVGPPIDYVKFETL